MHHCHSYNFNSMSTYSIYRNIKKRRSSSVVAGSRLSSYGLGSTSHCPPEPTMHWSEEMSSETDTTSLSAQMKLAKDMGYTDDEITRAVSLNSARDGSYQPFSSPSEMIDMLSEVQKTTTNSEPSNLAHVNNTGDSGLELDRSSYVSTSPPRTPAIGVRRTISFHTVSSAQAARHDPLTPSMYEMRYNRGNNFQLQRLLDAFDKERKSFIDESTKSIKMLEEQCRTESNTVKYLNTLMDTKQMEIYSLKNKLDTQNEALNQTQNLLDIQVHESCSKAEELRNLQKEYDRFKGRSLTETETKEKEIRELREKLSKAEDSLKTKQEECLSLRKDMARLTEVVTKQETELEQCKNFKAEIRKAEQRIEEMRIERDNVISALNMIPTCVICLDKRPQVLYMPCSHFVCCESCGKRFENCPTCRQKICGKITVYQ